LSAEALEELSVATEEGLLELCGSSSGAGRIDADAVARLDFYHFDYKVAGASERTGINSSYYFTGSDGAPLVQRAPHQRPLFSYVCVCVC
jgi:hypothetical protein